MDVFALDMQAHPVNIFRILKKGGIMKRCVFLMGAVLASIIPQTMPACPVGWDYFYEDGARSQGFAFSDKSTHYVGVGTLYESNLFYRNLLVVDINAWPEWPSETVWTKVYDNVRGEGRSIIAVPDGFVIAGTIPEYTDSGGPYVMMLMIDDTGKVIWENHDCQGMGYSLTASPDGGYLVAGKSYISDDLLLVKYDEEGDTVLTKTYGTVNDDEGRTISPTSDGNYVVAGTRAASGSGQNGQLWWLKLDQTGEIIWQHTLGAANYDYWGTSIQELDNGGFIIGGGSGEQGVEVDKNLVVIKTDASGNPEWTKEHYACLYFSNPTPYCVSKGTAGGFIATGEGFDFAKLDSTGEIEWERQYTNALSCFVQWTDSARYVSIGETDSMFFMLDANEDGWINITGVAENSSSLPELEVLNPSPVAVTLKYSNRPNGFHAYIYDVSGRKVDELHSSQSEGSIRWGVGHGPGAYFIKETSGGGATKAVMIR